MLTSKAVVVVEIPERYATKENEATVRCESCQALFRENSYVWTRKKVGKHPVVCLTCDGQHQEQQDQMGSCACLVVHISTGSVVAVKE